MSFSSVAEKSFTGIVTSPKEIAPFQIERGMFLVCPIRSRVPSYAEATLRVIAGAGRAPRGRATPGRTHRAQLPPQVRRVQQQGSPPLPLRLPALWPLPRSIRRRIAPAPDLRPHLEPTLRPVARPDR